MHFSTERIYKATPPYNLKISIGVQTTKIMRRAAKVDKNQKEIVTALKAAGAGIIYTYQLKNAFDILVVHRGNTYIVEIKQPKKKLTEGEEKCRDLVESKGVKYWVITSVEEALKMIGQ